MNRSTKPRFSVVMPAYNEANSIGNMIANSKTFSIKIIVVDDGSTDDTSEIAKKSGALVIWNEKISGVTKTTQKGLDAAHGDIIVTLDADGQHDPSDALKLIKLLAEGKCEVAMGTRNEIPHRSERIINALTNLSVECSGAGTDSEP